MKMFRFIPLCASGKHPLHHRKTNMINGRSTISPLIPFFFIRLSHRSYYWSLTGWFYAACLANVLCSPKLAPLMRDTFWREKSNSKRKRSNSFSPRSSLFSASHLDIFSPWSTHLLQILVKHPWCLCISTLTWTLCFACWKWVIILSIWCLPLWGRLTRLMICREELLHQWFRLIIVLCLSPCSGRTSRREIRKLLWECCFWRCQRTKAGRRGSRIHTHSFLFDDDDDDTERSIATNAATSYSNVTSHSHPRSHHLPRENSHGNYSTQTSRQASVFNCCGLTIDLSNKQASNSSNGESSSRHSTLGKPATNNYNTTSSTLTTTHHYYYSPRKMRRCSQSPMSLSSFDHHLGQQKIISYKSNNDNHRTIARRRATTAVHCFRRLPSSTTASITSKPSTFNTESKRICSSISNDNDGPTGPILQETVSDGSTTPVIVVYNTDINPAQDIADSPVSVKNHFEEQPVAAYAVEQC